MIKKPLWTGSCLKCGSIVCTLLLGPCMSGMGRGLRPSAVPTPNSHFLLYACIPTTGWMLVVTSLVIAPPYSNKSCIQPVVGRPRVLAERVKSMSLPARSAEATPAKAATPRASSAQGIVLVCSHVVSASLTYRRPISSSSSSRAPSFPQSPLAMVWVKAYPTYTNEQKRCAIPSPRINHAP